MEKETSTDPGESTPRRVGEGLWTLTFPLRFFGLHLGRRVCLLQLSGGRLAIHSTGPFSSGQRDAIRALGRPAILLDGTTMHDTFSKEARAVFPEIPYFVPEGFSRKASGEGARSIAELDSATGGELQSARIEGIRLINEFAVFHPASRTLLLCDLLFNLIDARGYTRWAMKYLMGVKEWPAIDRPVRMAVRDKAAFRDSIREILRWDFDRIVVAHGAIIESDGPRILREAAERAGF